MKKEKKVDPDISAAMALIVRARWNKASPADRKRVGRMLADARKRKHMIV
jgi:hypothetical protein